MTKNEHFRKLHQQQRPLIIANVWDVNSAVIFEDAGYQAVGTSSAALANTFGFADGETLPFDVLLTMISCIVGKVSIPVSVDMEGGYGRTAGEIVSNIEQLVRAGAVGINLEDSLLDGERRLQEVDTFMALLVAIRKQLSEKRLDVFVNVRTDGFLLQLPNAMEETLRRIKAYQEAGADGIFIPCIVNPADIEAAVQAADVPVNVMAMPSLPDFVELQKLGVRRISMGNALHKSLNRELQGMVKQLHIDGSFKSLF